MRNWLSIGREFAGEKFAMLYTLVGNCRRLGIDPKDYLDDVLTHVPSMQATEAPSLIPAKWQQACLAKVARPTACSIAVIETLPTTFLLPP